MPFVFTRSLTHGSCSAIIPLLCGEVACSSPADSGLFTPLNPLLSPWRPPSPLLVLLGFSGASVMREGWSCFLQAWVLPEGRGVAQ